MSLKNYLLGMLSLKSRSGYSLHKGFFEPVRPSLSQIYRTLAEMNEEGLIDVERVQQEKLPDQRLCHITEAGRAKLSAWLKEPIPLQPVRDRFGAQLWFSSFTCIEDVIGNITRYKADLESQVEWFETEARMFIKKGAKSTNEPMNEVYWNLTIDLTVAQMNACREWAEEALARLLNIKNKKSKSSQSSHAAGKRVTNKNVKHI